MMPRANDLPVRDVIGSAIFSPSKPSGTATVGADHRWCIPFEFRGKQYLLWAELCQAGLTFGCFVEDASPLQGSRRRVENVRRKHWRREKRPRDKLPQTMELRDFSHTDAIIQRK